jgi:hypothetical protein
VWLITIDAIRHPAVAREVTKALGIPHPAIERAYLASIDPARRDQLLQIYDCPTSLSARDHVKHSL